MATLLHIQASPMKERSFSLQAAQVFIEAYAAAHPSDTIQTVDVFGGAVPEFGVLQVAAKYKILHGKPASAEEAAAWKGVEAAIAAFKAADRIVISSAMWNFGIPYMLKKYIDVIVQPGYTFSYSPAEGYKGLCPGKRAALILARGGAYPAGTPGAALDFQRPYLETTLGFMGITDVRTIVVEPTLMEGPDRAAELLKAAQVQAREMAKGF